MKFLRSIVSGIMVCSLLLGTGCSGGRTASNGDSSLADSPSNGGDVITGNAASSGKEDDSGISASGMEYVRVPLKKGMNLTCWEMEEWRPREYLLEEKYYYELADKGFDHVRIPVKFSLYASSAESNPIPKDFLSKLDRAIKLAFKYDLYVVLDMHGCGDINNNTENWKQPLYAQWRQLAEHYKDYDDRLLFELLNEPADGGNKGISPLNSDKLNEIMNETIRVIREIDKERVLVAAVSPMNMVYSMDTVDLPADDSNIIAAVHSYEPLEFTHQGAAWSSQIADRNAVPWKDEYKKVISEVIAKAAAWSKNSGRQVWLGEFGVCLDVAAENDVSEYLSFITDECEKYDIGWCYWEFWMSFGAYDRKNECWKNYVLDPLMN